MGRNSAGSSGSGKAPDPPALNGAARLLVTPGPAGVLLSWEWDFADPYEWGLFSRTPPAQFENDRFINGSLRLYNEVRWPWPGTMQRDFMVIAFDSEGHEINNHSNVATACVVDD
jgi:hypothetical protein